MAQVKSIKGTHDILPNQTKDWQELEMQVHKKLQIFMGTVKLEHR